ncbi:MAG: signal recognition particle protein, partial [Pseudomonadota bacterium]
DRIQNKGAISERDLDVAMRDIRIALMEADVALSVAKDLIEAVKVEALGQNIIKSVTPGQMIIKIFHDKLEELLGSEAAELNFSGNKPHVILLAGLQGAGKTTFAAKLAKFLITAQGEEKQTLAKKVLLASLDVYRPAAQEQLAILAEQVGCASLSIEPKQKPKDIAKRALNLAKKEQYDVVILDLAGRSNLDQDMMQEAKDVAKVSCPDEVLLLADSLTGQSAVDLASGFNNALNLTGLVMTRVDADHRGGAILSMKAITGVPIKFISQGEKISDLSYFYPERVASRILDKGDIVSLVEQATASIGEEDADSMLKRLEKGKFDLNDYIKQIKMIMKLGGANSIMGMLPGMGKITEKIKGGAIDEEIFVRQLAIYSSMTKKERRFPKLVNGSRKKRIAGGSGRSVQEINTMLKQFKEMEKMVKKLGKLSKNPRALSQLTQMLG